MDDQSLFDNRPPAERAQFHLEQANTLKKEGKFDSALTEYRRAAMANPTLMQAHFEIGKLCKSRATTDPLFLRHSFDAFRQAARLDLQHQEAHDNYITAAQQMGKLDELLLEYENWIKFNPDNDLLKRCKKNIVTITMALIPQQVNIGEAKASGTIRKLTLVASVGLMLFGLVLIFAPPIANRGKNIFDRDQMRRLMRVGIVLDLIGFAGLIAFTKMK